MNTQAVKCPKCSADNPPDNKFCGKCATSLVLKCSNCGTENPPVNFLCSKCNTPLQSPEETPKPQSVLQPQLPSSSQMPKQEGGFDFAAFVTSFASSLAMMTCGGTTVAGIAWWVFAIIIYALTGGDGMASIVGAVILTVLFYIIAFFCLWWAQYKAFKSGTAKP